MPGDKIDFWSQDASDEEKKNAKKLNSKNTPTDGINIDDAKIKHPENASFEKLLAKELDSLEKKLFIFEMELEKVTHSFLEAEGKIDSERNSVFDKLNDAYQKWVDDLVLKSADKEFRKKVPEILKSIENIKIEGALILQKLEEDSDSISLEVAKKSVEYEKLLDSQAKLKAFLDKLNG